MSDRTFRWQNGALLPADLKSAPLLVADSWLVEDGRVRGLRRHEARFSRSCAEVAALSREVTHHFFRALVQKLPRRGRWFPRAELVDARPFELRLRLRPAPPQGGAMNVWVADAPDPREAPRRKGPDFARLAELRRRAAEFGAGEALLTTPSGLVLEGAYSSLFWWEGADLCRPSPALRVLPGVTAALIEDLAARRGVRVRSCRRRACDLVGLEAWLVNALHGIRPVTAWMVDGHTSAGHTSAGHTSAGHTSAGLAERAARWQDVLVARARPLPERA